MPKKPLARPSLIRPQPPHDLVTSHATRFEPAPDLEAWLRATFINEDAILVNPDHAHLRFAKLGVLWTNVGNSRQQRTIVGQCEAMPPHVMGKWAKARAEMQIEGWFASWFEGGLPDFLLTFDARYAAIIDNATFCALAEHELYHAGQERDLDGVPKFKMDGTPKYAILGHDVETFIGVARRYGAVESNVAQLVNAVLEGPRIAKAQVGMVCGTCLKVAA